MRYWKLCYLLSMVLVACQTGKDKEVSPPISERERAISALEEYEQVYINTLNKADAMGDSIFSRLARIEDTLTKPEYLRSQDIINDEQINDLWAEALMYPSIVQARARIERRTDGTRFDFKLNPNLLIGIEETRFDTLLYGIDLTGGYGVSTVDEQGLTDQKLVEIENAVGDRKEGLNIYVRMFIAYEKKNAPR